VRKEFPFNRWHISHSSSVSANAMSEQAAGHIGCVLPLTVRKSQVSSVYLTDFQEYDNFLKTHVHYFFMLRFPRDLWNWHCTTKIILTTACWDIAPCSLIAYRRFRGAYCLHHRRDESTRHSIPEGCYLHTLRRENLKSHAVILNKQTNNGYR
jgi:hypothetical protein